MKRREDDIDVQGKAPGFWFYPQDFERDMQILSLESQGLWARMLCWMHFNQRNRGYLELATGEPMNTVDIAAKSGKPIEVIERLMEEMRRHGIYSVDGRQCILNRRMVKDTDILTKRKLAAEKRASGAIRTTSGTFAPAKHPAKNGRVGNVVDGMVDGYRLQRHHQNTVLSDSVPDSVPDASLTKTIKHTCASNGAVVDEPEFFASIKWVGGWKFIKKASSDQLTAIEALREEDIQPSDSLDSLHMIWARLQWFEEFWMGYWRKVDKKAARIAYFEFVPTLVIHDQVVAAVEAQSKAMNERPEEKRPHAATWIRHERWTDAAQLFPSEGDD